MFFRVFSARCCLRVRHVSFAASPLQSLLLAEPQAQINPATKIRNHSRVQDQGARTRVCVCVCVCVCACADCCAQGNLLSTLSPVTFPTCRDLLQNFTSFIGAAQKLHSISTNVATSASVVGRAWGWSQYAPERVMLICKVLSQSTSM